jgi:hypothetical protein
VEPLEQRLDLFLLQLELLRHLVQLRHVDAAVLVGVLEENRDGVVHHGAHIPPVSRSLTLRPSLRSGLVPTYFLVPVIVIGSVVVLFGLLILLGRIRGGRYLRPLVTQLAKIPWLRRSFQKMSTAALEKQNPELASAMRKMQRLGSNLDPQRAQQALSSLSASERRAYLQAVQEQGAMPEPANRQMRRQQSRLQPGTKPQGTKPQRGGGDTSGGSGQGKRGGGKKRRG